MVKETLPTLVMPATLSLDAHSCLYILDTPPPVAPSSPFGTTGTLA